MIFIEGFGLYNYVTITTNIGDSFMYIEKDDSLYSVLI